MFFLVEFLDQNNLVLEIKKNLLVYLFSFMKFSTGRKFKDEFNFLVFLDFKKKKKKKKRKAYESFPINNILKKNLIILLFMVNFFTLLLIYILFRNLVQILMVNFQKNF